jgi:hypothetical protein
LRNFLGPAVYFQSFKCKAKKGTDDTYNYKFMEAVVDLWGLWIYVGCGGFMGVVDLWGCGFIGVVVDLWGLWWIYDADHMGREQVNIKF